MSTSSTFCAFCHKVKIPHPPEKWMGIIYWCTCFPGNLGWTCQKCGRSNAPFVSQCPCSNHGFTS